MRSLARTVSASLLVLLVGSGCDGCGDPEVASDGEGAGPSSSSTEAGSPGSTGSGGDDTATPSVAVSGSSSTGVDPCADVDCGAGFQCIDGECEPLSCADADCTETEECVEVEGGGHVCDDISCDDDVDCPEERFCNDDGICVDDTCDPGVAHCEDEDVVQCAENGSGETSNITCGSDAYFDSTCTEGDDTAFCPCQDDWDCPANTVCDVGTCTGTGLAPTCSVPPLPFDELLPGPEIVWGSPEGVLPALAVNTAYPASTQVTATPLVINLDDDNGDGLINERDFPEIIFISSLTNLFGDNGVLRAIHGGGPDKGEDVFATYGTTTWHPGDPIVAGECDTTANCAAADVLPLGGLAAGDLDNDGAPEIVAVLETGAIRIYRPDGTVESTTAAGIVQGGNIIVSVANVDNAGFAELAIGGSIYTLGHDVDDNLVVVDRFRGLLGTGSNGGGRMSCIANLVGDERQELIAGSTVYRLPAPPAGATTQADCVANPPVTPDEVAFCDGELVPVWDGVTVNGAGVLPNREGFCAIADVLGTDADAAPSPSNPLDGSPEVILIDAAHLLILDGATGELRRDIPFDDNGSTLGGAPNVDDFDGDGFPEIGTAAAFLYKVFDLQETADACPLWPDPIDDDDTLEGQGPTNPDRSPPPGACDTASDCSDQVPGTTCNVTTHTCVCLYNGWERVTEDDSSQITGSSVFDFNGDGAAEVVYNDECFFRIYGGLDGRVLFREPSESPTQIEYPVIADVDNDGNAEIVFGTNSGSNRCSLNDDPNYNGGIEVWGDPTDQWVSARRIWNEHAYHVTNVTEGGAILLTEPESWKPYNGRLYNTYRSNPRSYGVAPDLTPVAVQVSSPDATCGELGSLLDIAVRVENQGDLRVGPGVVVAFFGTWDGDEEALRDGAGDPLIVTLQQSLEPGESTIISASYDSDDNDPGTLPDSIRVVVDAEEAETECREDNNEATEPVDAGELRADLHIEVAELTDPCNSAALEAEVTNEGSAPAEDILVRFYLGDPDQGGAAIAEETIAGPLDPGDSTTVEADLGALPDGAIIHALVDPDDAIEECDEGDNQDATEDPVECGPN